MSSVAHRTEPMFQRWLVVIDAWCERIGDAVNPILVKEARQALKSRQFLFSFSALLLAALGWTIVGSLSMMPQIYTMPSAPRMLTGYYFVLAVPMMLVVPMAAYRSLEGEIDDGTLELLSISALGPWQIVLGKLASALLQMLLYFVALFPSVAYAYNLRGVDLPTILLIMGMLLVTAVLLTIGSLFMAAISSSRTGRITSLFVVVAMLLAVQWSLGGAVVTMIRYGNPLNGSELLFVVTAVISLSLSGGLLLLTATAAQLTPESENRSTKIRLAMMLMGAVVVALNVLAISTLERDALPVNMFLFAAIGMLWIVAGSMMAAESPIQTPRIRRELPHSFLARCLLTWLTPGPAAGLVFAVVNILLLTAAAVIAAEVAIGRYGGTRNLGWQGLGWQGHWAAVVFAAYLIMFLVVVRVIVSIIRIKTHPRAEVGLVVLLVVALLFALVPYSIQLHLNDYRDYQYSMVQITNWAWTIDEILDGRDGRWTAAILGSGAGIAFLIALISASQLTLPRRIATPTRVMQEKQGTSLGV